MRMRRLAKVRQWDILEPNPWSGSVLSATRVDRDGYKVRDGFQVQHFNDGKPYVIRMRYDPADEPDSASVETPQIDIEPFLAGPFLVEAKPKAFHQVGVTHNPLALTGLHVEFSELRTNQDIERFSSRYGQLGYGFQVQSSSSAFGGASSTLYGESVRFWYHHIGIVRLFRRIWPLISDEREEELVPFVSRQIGVGFTEVAFDRFATPFSQPFGTASKYEIEDEPLSTIGYWTIDEYVNEQIQNATCLRMNAGDPNVYIIVSDLLGALYWHLARELAGSTPHIRLCQHCQSLIHDARVDAKYCSADCRQKAFQLKKKQGNQS